MTEDPTTHQIHCNPTLCNMSSRNCHAQDLSAQTATKDSNWHLTFSHWNLSKRYTCNDVSIIRLHCSIIVTNWVVWSVVCHTSQPCKKRLNRSRCSLGSRLKEPYIGWKSRSPDGKGQFGEEKRRPIVKYRDTLRSAVQKGWTNRDAVWIEVSGGWKKLRITPKQVESVKCGCGGWKSGDFRREALST